MSSSQVIYMKIIMMTVTSADGYELSFIRFLILPRSQVPHFLSQKYFKMFGNVFLNLFLIFRNFNWFVTLTVFLLQCDVSEYSSVFILYVFVVSKFNLCVLKIKIKLRTDFFLIFQRQIQNKSKILSKIFGWEAIIFIEEPVVKKYNAKGSTR